MVDDEIATHWGATPEEWAQFDVVLGLGEDLLPVVSNPSAKISAKSGIKTLGKTPSVYNKRGEVIGIPEWTALRALPSQIAKWSAKPDYGICIQTRRVRALDIDVPEREQSAAIADFIVQMLPPGIAAPLPLRSRADSGKCLLAFILEGEFSKRVMKVEGGIVEFLANGQQFIAAGTHPGGARYEWEWWGHTDFPVLTGEQFEQLWAELVKTFAIEPPHESGNALRNPRIADGNVSVTIDDPVAAYLAGCEAYLGAGPEGQIFIACPWKSGHSSDSGITETAYFPAGGRGYARGHFKCLHASCAARTDADFEDMLGVAAADFEVIEQSAPAAEGGSKALDTFAPYKLRRDKNGVILPILNNLLRSVRAPEHCGMEIKYDAFRDEIVRREFGDGSVGNGPHNALAQPWGPFTDVDYTRLRSRLEAAGYGPLGTENVREAVAMVAHENTFDSAIEWVRAQVWDGVPRIGTFLSAYWGAEDSPYTRAVSMYIWTALAGRALVPGIKADMVPIMQGEQGLYKSSAVEALVPGPELFCEIRLGASDDENARKMRGVLAVELNELSGLHTRALQDIKAFIVRRHEKWIPKYKEFAATFMRRCLMIGTSNEDELFNDPTGERRWLPFKVVSEVRLDDLRADRKLLWAEGREVFELIGVDWAEAQALAPAEHEKFAAHDEGWEHIIAEWLDTPDGVDGETPAQTGVRIDQILMGALGRSAGEVVTRDERRVRNILRKMGWRTSLVRRGAQVLRVWRQK